jgi:hypothetical protein
LTHLSTGVQCGEWQMFTTGRTTPRVID